VLPYLCFTKGLQYVENTKASIIVAVEPVIASFIGVIVYNEEMTVIKLAGVVLVLLAVVICSKD
jgi:drug/metabolite transporter (DMT)-like permease